MYSADAYVDLLGLFLREGYRFLRFDEPEPAGRKAIYLRHDVDCSPRWAEDFARLNARCGVIGTFCFLLRSPLYNLAAPETLRHVEAVLGLGQRVGFHYAFAAAPPDDLEIVARMVRADFDIAHSIVPRMEPLFCWHNPSLLPNLIDRTLDLAVPGLVNLYGRRFFRDMAYKSDSNRRYSIAEWQQIARAGHPRMQLLMHPFDWLAGGDDVRRMLANTFAEVARTPAASMSEHALYREAHPDGLGEDALAAIADIFYQWRAL